MARDILTDEQWERMRTVLPPQKPKTGRPAKDHRLVINGILWILRTGAPWRDLPTEYGPWQTIATPFYRWVKVGVWDRVLASPTTPSRHRGHARLELAPCRWDNGPSTPARGRCTKKGTQAAGTEMHADEALGRSKGGLSTKIHLRAEGTGKPITFLITAGQRHEQSVFEALMETGAVKRAGRGRPCSRPERVAGDKGYSSKKIRWYLRRRGIGVVIARKKRERRGRFDKQAYRKRNVVERLMNRLKQFRRIATRYEKRAANYLGMLTLAAIVLWL